MKSAQRKAERPTLSGAREALFRGAFEDCLAICDALPNNDVETDLLRARAYISLNRADRALDAVRRLRLRAEPTDESLTARMLEGAALLKLGQLDDGLAVLHAAHADARRAHPTIRAEISIHIGIGHYREGQFPQALHHLRSVPENADIVHARAILFEGWVMFDSGDVEGAAERFRAALRRIASCHRYDRFIEASALYALAFLCAEIPKPEWWPEIRERANTFDWTTSGVVIPLFLLAHAASYVAELRGEFDEAREWLSRAQAAAPSPFYEIVATVRLAELVGRYGERLSHAYFTSSALARFETLRNDALLREDNTLPLTLAEELAQGSNPADATPLLTYYAQVIAPRVRGTKDEGMLDASAALTQGYIEEASGRSARARERYRTAMDQYDAMGYRRRAAVAAYRLAVLTGEERHRAYVRDAVRDASPAYWLNERLTNLGVQEVRLTERQADVLRLLVAGRSNKEIATIRGGSWYTARNIVRELLGTFGVRSRGELVRVAIARGAAAPPPSETA